jgi:hypothetical protein
MATPMTVDVVAIASAAFDVASSDLTMTIASLQAAAATSRERAVGVVAAVGAPVGTTAVATAAAHPH